MSRFEDVLNICRIVGNKLIEKGVTVAFAESCTAGLAAAALADVSGISAVFTEGAVTYANEAKVRLGVDVQTIAKHGAVSRETASEMANCIRERAGSDFGVSVTGIAGPGGGTAEKPVGLVYIALSTKESVLVKKLNLSGGRFEIRCFAVYNMMKLIEEELEKHD